MKIIKLHTAWKKLQGSLKGVTKVNNKVKWTKEEILMNRLVDELGKSRQEVSQLISKDLLSLLSLVPFSK